MKSQKARKFIDRCINNITAEFADYAKQQLRVAMTHTADLAEQEVEERMRAKAIEAFCAANCPKGCSFGADGNIGCGAKVRFIQKLSKK